MNDKTDGKDSFIHQFKSFNEEDTMRIAAELAKCIVPGDIITLDGDLGAGKTVFARGLISSLGIDDYVTVMVKKRTNATLWENQPAGCMINICDNERATSSTIIF